MHRRSCLFSIERRQTPSLYTGESVSLLCREEADPVSVQRRARHLDRDPLCLFQPRLSSEFVVGDAVISRTIPETDNLAGATYEGSCSRECLLSAIPTPSQCWNAWCCCELASLSNRDTLSSLYRRRLSPLYIGGRHSLYIPS